MNALLVLSGKKKEFYGARGRKIIPLEELNFIFQIFSFHAVALLFRTAEL